MRQNLHKAVQILGISIASIVILGVLFYFSTHSSKVAFTSPSIFSPHNDLTILVVGDIMLDRNVRNKIGVIGFDAFFSGVKDLVSNADIAVANLEGPFTNYPSKTASLVNKDLVFTFDPTLVPKLADLGFDILGLANNHTLNFGHEGLAMTRDYIKNAGMWYYGDPDNLDETSVVIEKEGIKVGFVGFHEFSNKNFENILHEIDRLRPEVDILIVTPHWGVEYQKSPTTFMTTWAHEFIDHGADVVIGSHPHVIGDQEEYLGKKIYYSLGNFVFDQYFSDETMQGLGVLMTMGGDKKIQFEEVKVNVGRGGPTVDL